MKVDVDKVSENNNGWYVRLKVNLSPEELLILNKDAIRKIEDFNIDLNGSNLYFNCFLNTQEPWEDEPLEELLKSIKLEVEYHTKALLNKSLK